MEARPASFSVVTYNLFIGTALSVFPPKTPLLGGASCTRLAPQLAAVAALKADVLGLQEVHKDSLVDSYRDAFAATHALVHGVFHNALGLGILVAWRVVISCCALAALGCLALAGDPPLSASPTYWVLAALAALCSSFFLVHKGVVAYHFLTGRVHGGLALLLRRSTFAVRASYVRNFTHQNGDILNLLRPRAFQVVLAEVLGSSSSSSSSPCLVLFFHTHANLGHGEEGERCRASQLKEIIGAGSPAEVQRLLDAAGLHGVPPHSLVQVLLGDLNAEYSSASLQASLALGGFLDPCTDSSSSSSSPPPPSWDNGRNPLTNGVLLDEDSRVDLVLYRNPEAGSAALTLSPLTSGSTSLVLNQPPFLSDHFGVRVHFACHYSAPPRAHSPKGRSVSLQSLSIAENANPDSYLLELGSRAEK